MLKFTRIFGKTLVRMILTDTSVYYSAYDVATALNFLNKRKVVNDVVVMEKGVTKIFEWENENVLFIDTDYVVSLSFKSNHNLAKDFFKWLLEVSRVANHIKPYETILNEDKRHSNRSNNHYAITQIAKKYGMSGKELNLILNQQNIQYKVNDQWVLYSNYQDKDFTKVLKVRVKNDVFSDEDNYVLHTYWTEKGAKFIEEILTKLGYEQQGEQLNLF